MIFFDFLFIGQLGFLMVISIFITYLFFSFKRKNLFWLLHIGNVGVILVLFSLIYVSLVFDMESYNIKKNSNVLESFVWKISAIWSSSEGSIFFWCCIFYTLSYFFYFRNLWITNFFVAKRSYYIIIILSLFFFVYTCLYSNPFIKTFVTCLVGSSINPVLMDPAMLIHPVLLYTGNLITLLSSLSVVLLFLITNRFLGKNLLTNLTLMRQLNKISFLLLSMAILLGAAWSYWQSGWGSVYWVYDPVENISLFPWLVSLVLLHIYPACIKKANNLLIYVPILNFLNIYFLIIGTTIIRSGVVTSLHTFISETHLLFYNTFAVFTFLFFFCAVYLLRNQLSFYFKFNINSLNKNNNKYKSFLEKSYIFLVYYCIYILFFFFFHILFEKSLFISNLLPFFSEFFPLSLNFNFSYYNSFILPSLFILSYIIIKSTFLIENENNILMFSKHRISLSLHAKKTITTNSYNLFILPLFKNVKVVFQLLIIFLIIYYCSIALTLNVYVFYLYNFCFFLFIFILFKSTVRLLLSLNILKKNYWMYYSHLSVFIFSIFYFINNLITQQQIEKLVLQKENIFSNNSVVLAIKQNILQAHDHYILEKITLLFKNKKQIVGETTLEQRCFQNNLIDTTQITKPAIWTNGMNDLHITLTLEKASELTNENLTYIVQLLEKMSFSNMIVFPFFIFLFITIQYFWKHFIKYK